MEQLFVFSVFLNLVVAQVYRNESGGVEDSIELLMAECYEEAYVDDMTRPRTKSEVKESLRRTMATSTWFD